VRRAALARSFLRYRAAVRSADEFLHLTTKQLLAELKRGHAIAAEELSDTEYRGTSLGLPQFVERLTWKKFKKTFHRDASRCVLRGWNVRLEQNALEEPCVPLKKHGGAVTFGHYHVLSPEGHRIPKGCDRGLLIHYGHGKKSALDFNGLVRDPLVAVNPGDTRLLLGWSYLDLGFCLGTPSFFTLEYDCALTEIIEPPT
jgi:hypothetical protein